MKVLSATNCATVKFDLTGKMTTESGQDRRTPRAPAVYLGRLLLASFVVLVVALSFFCPRWVTWKPAYWSDPIINRALDALRQLQDPWVRIENPSNKVIENRLLFPLLGYCLRLPPLVFLAIPLLGCWAVVLLMLDRLVRRTGDWLLAMFGTTVLSSTSWFFTSTGWLAYFDSWIILGLLVVTTCPARSLMVAACLLAPWADERFVLGLPVALTARTLYMRGTVFHFARRDVVSVLLASLPFLMFRVHAVLVNGSPEVLEHGWLSVSASRYLEGLWAGFRCVWVLIGLLLFKQLRGERPVNGVLLPLLGVATLLANFRLAADLSRGVSVLLPIAYLSLLPPARSSSVSWRRVVGGIMILNLLLPAHHVVAYFTTPIENVVAEYHSGDPPHLFHAEFFLQKADRCAQRGELAAALRDIDVGLLLLSESAHLCNARSQLLCRMGNFDEAVLAADRALLLDPELAVAHFNRGIAHERQANFAAALADYGRALSLLPAESQLRQVVEDRWVGLKKRLD